MSNNAMTQNSDRSLNDLETIEEILLTTARRAEATDVRLDRLSESLDHLREDVDIAFQTINLLSENTNRAIAEQRQEMAEFRSTMLRLQTENQRIWQYLMRQYQDGNGDRS